MQKKSFSWGISIVMFFVFFPVGIWMIVKKMTDEKYNYLKNGKTLKAFGWVLVFMGIIYLMMGLTGELKTTDGESATAIISLMSIFFIGGGLFTVFKGKQFIACGNKFNRYASIVNARNDYSIDSIAAAYPIEYEKACNDLQQMIDYGYFLNSYIDLNLRELITPKTKTAKNTDASPTLNENQKPKIIKCPNCGATNTIANGVSHECEYCGSQISGK